MWAWIKKQKIAITIFILFFVPLLPYYIKFRHYTISSNPSDWADFGSYIGGVYTVVVSILAVFLTRHFEKKDLAWKKLQEAVGAIFVQLQKIDYSRVNVRAVSKLLQIVHENELYIPSDLYVMLTNLHDDYLDAKECPEKFDVEKEVKVKQRLKKLYES